jgi:hypothetical protein
LPCDWAVGKISLFHIRFRQAAGAVRALKL